MYPIYQASSTASNVRQRHGREVTREARRHAAPSDGSVVRVEKSGAVYSGPERPLSAADSIDRRNALSKALCRRFEVERLPGAFVQLTSYGIELALTNIRQVHAFREVLA